jgi:beta-galactosidase
VVDERGVRVPAAGDRITFQVDGPAALVAVDNGNPASHEAYQGRERSAFRGRCLALVRATADGGPITVTASAPGLSAGSVTLEGRER